MVEKMATRSRRSPTAEQTMPAMAIPPPLNICGLLRILPMARMPSTRPAMENGAPKKLQQHAGIERMPRTIEMMARGVNFGWPPIIIGPPGGPKPPGGGPNPPPGGGP
jgi:hypothetical protein